MRLYRGDCLEILAAMAEAGELFDSAVMDPPYNLASIQERFGADEAAQAFTRETGVYRRSAAGFMGQRWDTDVAFQVETWRRVFAVMKPGAYLLAFSATRTYHRMAAAIEAAGFVVYDMLAWTYGSGFPKNHNIPKGIDRSLGHTWTEPYEPISDQAKAYEGTGTALKPAWEPICVAMRPREGTIVQNLLRYGTGVLNIRDCRIGTEEELRTGAAKLWSHYRDGEASAKRRYSDKGGTNFAMTPGPRGADPDGRWPANLLHDGSDEVVRLFPTEAGQRGDVRGDEPSGTTNQIYNSFAMRVPAEMRADSGSAARFFYSGKAKSSERIVRCAECGTRYLGKQKSCCGLELETHATVKPVDVMRWLVRLVTPAGGQVLDCFAGTGTTAVAALQEGCRPTLIEIDPAHVADIEFRLAAMRGHDTPLFGGAAA